MAEHTPGPWEVVRKEPDYGTIYTYEIWADIYGNKSCNRLITMTGQGCLPDKTVNANAALIAAAPDLLALVEAVEWVDEHAFLVQRCAWCGGSRAFGHTLSCPRQQALARAKGQEREGEKTR